MAKVYEEHGSFKCYQCGKWMDDCGSDKLDFLEGKSFIFCGNCKCKAFGKKFHAPAPKVVEVKPYGEEEEMDTESNQVDQA